MSEELKIPHYAEKAASRLKSGATLVRQCSLVDEAVDRGDGYLYFTHPDGRAFPTASGAFVVKHGLVEPLHDGLFGGSSQTFTWAGDPQ